MTARMFPCDGEDDHERHAQDGAGRIEEVNVGPGFTDSLCS
jgi:hypothetical protein